MAIFISKHRKYSISIDGKIYHFEPKGMVGMFRTEDEDLIVKIRKSSDYKKGFDEHDIPKNGDISNIISGVRSSATQVQLGESEAEDIKKKTIDQLTQKFKRYDELKPLVLKLDGKVRLEAKKEDIDELNQLSEELGLDTIA